MKTPIEEQYVLKRLSLIDMGRTLRSLEYLEGMADEHLREALFRDAVVSYAKPFSDNKGIHTKKGLRINEKGIPPELKLAHAEVVNVRNTLFAHMDIDIQKPELEHYEIDGEKHHPFTVAGYGKVYVDHLVKPLEQLAKAVRAHLLLEISSIEKDHF